jgi:hypothetical protein
VIENAECGGARMLMMSLARMLSFSVNVYFLPVRSRRV